MEMIRKSTMTLSLGSIGTPASLTRPKIELTVSDLDKEALKSGILFKRGQTNTAWKKRYFLFHNQHLYYFEPNYQEEKSRAKGSIGPLKFYTIEDGPDDSKKEQYCFQIIPSNGAPSNRVFFIYAVSPSEKSDWMEVLHNSSVGILPVTRLTVEIEKSLRESAYEIPEAEVEWSQSPSNQLKKGASGVVRPGIWMKTTQIAIKTLNNLPEFTDATEMNGFYKEIRTLSQLRHPNIVTMIGYCKKDNQVCLITEFVNGGNLADYIHESDRPMSLPLTIELGLSLCRGMIYLHNQDIVHRDLKPANILVQNLDSARIKVCDFGLAGITRGLYQEGYNSGSLEFYFGTPQYAAPELPTPGHNHKVDVFSFAIIMWEMVTRKRVWEGQLMQVADKVEKGERPPLPENHPLSDLIAKCWAHDPNSRPEFSAVYQTLEQILQKVQMSMPPSPQKVTKRLTAEEKIMMEWGQRDSLTWMQLKRILAKILACAPPTIDKLRFCLVDAKESVDKNVWVTFMRWFTPLYIVSYGYQNEKPDTTPEDEQKGYNIDQIADIVGASWFFGFLPAETAQSMLETKPLGTFLFRFSSTPGCYTLSANCGTVGHWRINASKEGTNPVFRVDTLKYKSLHEVIEKHGRNRDPLPGKIKEEHYLVSPLDKSLYPNCIKKLPNLDQEKK